MKILDFIVIGAQKSGTTSLFHYLRGHPDIYLPPEKEAPFFTPTSLYAKGVESYLESAFCNAPEDAAWGTMTPHYMTDPDVPSRIRETMPDVRLIAVLRNPIDRAVSHYKMCRRRELITDSFDVAVERQLQPEHLERARRLGVALETESECFVAWGEYGRILGNYLDNFPSDQLQIIFLDELSTSPESVIDGVLTHLNLPTGFRPSNLGVRYHVGGAKVKYPFIARCMRSAAAKKFWNMMTRIDSGRLQRSIQVRLEMWNTNIRADVDPMGAETRSKLISHFSPDIKSLSEAIGRTPPWPEWKYASASNVS